MSGLVLVAAAQSLSEFSVLDTPLLRVVGIGLVMWAAMLFSFVLRPTLRRHELFVVIAGDVGWVIGTLAVVAIASASFTTAGLITFIVLGVIVGDLAATQIIGMRRQAFWV
ncbi:MAG: hypothetical protein OEM97_11015 [Acidimicrobiia bacterium]|nr:hypothetical protein [Acidimicrobiia bacterium]